MVVELRQLINEISSFPEVVCKRGDLKDILESQTSLSQINTRGSYPEVFLSKAVLKNNAKFTDKHLCRSLLFNIVAGWKPETVRSNHWRCSVNYIGVFKKVNWRFRTSRS